MAVGFELQGTVVENEYGDTAKASCWLVDPNLLATHQGGEP